MGDFLQGEIAHIQDILVTLSCLLLFARGGGVGGPLTGFPRSMNYLLHNDTIV